MDEDTGIQRCWYVYSSPEVSGQARWHLLYDCLCWTFIGGGYENWYSAAIGPFG